MSMIVMPVEGFNAPERKIKLNPHTVCHAGNVHKSHMSRNPFVGGRPS